MRTVKVYIYNLKHPETNKVYYVGQTRALDERYYSHCINPKTKTGKEIKDKKLKPIIETLEIVDKKIAKDREKYWVKYLLNEGHELENIVFVIDDPYNQNKDFIKSKPLLKPKPLYPQEIIWLKSAKKILNMKLISEQIEIPQKNLWNYCNDVHSLNEMYWIRAVDWVRAFIKDSQPATLSFPEPSEVRKKIKSPITDVIFVAPTPSSYDSEKMNDITHDEAGQYQQPVKKRKLKQ